MTLILQSRGKRIRETLQRVCVCLCVCWHVFVCVCMYEALADDPPARHYTTLGGGGCPLTFNTTKTLQSLPGPSTSPSRLYPAITCLTNSV